MGIPKSVPERVPNYAAVTAGNGNGCSSRIAPEDRRPETTETRSSGGYGQLSRVLVVFAAAYFVATAGIGCAGTVWPMPPHPPAKYLGENRHPGLVPAGVLLSRWYFAGAPGPTGRKAGGGNWE